MKISETSNYDMFELIESNRPISWTKIDKMRERIKHKNLTSGYNIIVNSKEAGKERYGTDGKRYPIVDGQHRYISCKLEGQKFFYQINDDIELDDIPTAASLQHSWILIDYLHHYSTVGIHAYKQFVGYMNKNEFPPSTTLIILCGGRGVYFKTAFEQGEMKCSQSWLKAEAFAEAVNGTDTKKGVVFYLKYARNSRFVEAFWVLFRHKEYDHPRMMAKLEYLASTMQKCPDKSGFLRELSRVYNYNTRSKLRFYEEE